MWEIGTEDDADAMHSFVNVANSKIYQVKPSDEVSATATVFTVWLAQTGQMISTTRLDFGPVFKCLFPEYRSVTEPVRLILIKPKIKPCIHKHTGYCSIRLFWIVNPIQINHKYVIDNPNQIFKMD